MPDRAARPPWHCEGPSELLGGTSRITPESTVWVGFLYCFFKLRRKIGAPVATERV